MKQDIKERLFDCNYLQPQKEYVKTLAKYLTIIDDNNTNLQKTLENLALYSKTKHNDVAKLQLTTDDENERKNFEEYKSIVLDFIDHASKYFRAYNKTVFNTDEDIIAMPQILVGIKESSEWNEQSVRMSLSNTMLYLNEQYTNKFQKYYTNTLVTIGEIQ